MKEYLGKSVELNYDRSYSVVFNFDAWRPCDVLAFSPNGELLATALGSSLIVWNAKHIVANQERDACVVRQSRLTGGVITCMTWSLCGRYLAVGHAAGRFRLWDTRTWNATTYECENPIVSMHWTDNWALEPRQRRGSDADMDRLGMASTGAYSTALLAIVWKGAQRRMIRTYPFYYICARTVTQNPVSLWSSGDEKRKYMLG